VSDRRRGPHLSPVLTRGPFAVWWWTIVLGSGLATLAVLRPGQLPTIVDAGNGLVLVAALLLVSELRPVASDRSDPDGLNLSTAFIFAALLRWGPEVAVVGVVTATVLGEWVRRKELYKAVFNVAQYVLSYLAAWWVLTAFGWVASPLEPAVLRPADLPAVVVAAATYHVVNHLLVSVAVSLAAGIRLYDAVFERIVWYSTVTGATLAISPLVVVLLEADWRFVPLLVLPLGLTVATAKLAAEREERALVDELTGLANRTQLDHVVEERVAGTEQPAVLCLLDLDRFKEVNDTLGHATGDALLRAVAGRLRAACRDGDTVARLGGDEFAVLLDVPDLDAGEEVLQRLADTVRAPYDIAGAHLEVELSIGVALLPDHGRDLETALRRADLAMYEAKESGELVSRFRDELDRQTPSRLQLLADLRRALGAGELVLHYQPQVRIGTGELLGLEALVRWQHPVQGLLLPGAFLPYAERTSTMRELTETVLELAVTQLATWHAAGDAVSVSVNASLHDLADQRFADRVADRLREHGVPPHLLCLEITEQALVSDPTRVLTTLDALRALGVCLSLDDFGTGHASLTRLKRLPVDEVKIDRQFVVDLGTGGAADRAIVRSVIELAHACGLRTIAEGVETEEQHRTLADLGCDAIQGWVIARAMPPDELARWRATTSVAAREGVGVDG
jgi:diguanylate cyclase (GGDEF)-like protein